MTVYELMQKLAEVGDPYKEVVVGTDRTSHQYGKIDWVSTDTEVKVLHEFYGHYYDRIVVIYVA